MIGTLDVECQAKNPNLPLAPMTAFVNSPSSLRIRNVPKRIGDWCIRNVYVTCVYPDSSIQSVQCVLVGGIWVGTIQGTSTSGTSKNGYTIFADGTDENGNNVTGYILGKGDIEILEADGTLSPDPARYTVKLLSAEATQPREGDMYPTDDGYVIWQDGEAHLLGTPFEQISAYVDSAISSKADLSVLSGYIHNGAETAVIHDLTCDGSLVANNAFIEGYAKIDDLSSKADLSAIPTNTSQLSNDSGFITSADIITKRDLNDMTVKGVPQNTNSQSWFTIKYGTTTENAWYYDEGRWESGQTLRVLAVPATIYTLQKLQDGQWTNIGEFTLDNNAEATITYEGVTYSITGYVGEIVVSNQLISQIAALEARIAALEGN